VLLRLGPRREGYSTWRNFSPRLGFFRSVIRGGTTLIHTTEAHFGGAVTGTVTCETGG
jgi:hypothetical protein